MLPKFRVFDKKYKKIMKVNEINFEKSSVWIESDNGDHENRHTLTRGFDEVILMQTTGVYDKHGVEIFEWDILMSQDGTDGLISRFIVKRDEFYTGFIPMNREGYGFNRTMCEVIGNACQHPELLEAENE